MDAKPVICLMGPTASGKTALAIELTQRIPVQIVSVDSAMLYRTMDIGTAKPTPDILKQTTHRLIDIRDPSQHYSAGEFRQDALSAIDSILEQKQLPLLVGGSMLYFHVLQHGIAPLPKANPTMRQQLQQELAQQGLKKLHTRLQLIDPISAQRIHPNDPQRLLRALEVAAMTGQTLTELQRMQSPTPLPYQFINVAITPDDKDRHRHLMENRFQDMLKQGFVTEVDTLFKRGDLHAELPSMRTVGYRQIWRYLAGELAYHEMQERTAIATRQLAKRQMTWLRSWKIAHYLTMGNKNNINTLSELIKIHSDRYLVGLHIKSPWMN